MMAIDGSGRARLVTVSTVPVSVSAKKDSRVWSPVSGLSQRPKLKAAGAHLRLRSSRGSSAVV